MMPPILPPTIISAAITSVYAVIAVWIPVTVVPTSLATVAMDTFITELSSVITNWPAARVSRTNPLPAATAAAAGSEVATVSLMPGDAAYGIREGWDARHHAHHPAFRLRRESPRKDELADARG